MQILVTFIQNSNWICLRSVCVELSDFFFGLSNLREFDSFFVEQLLGLRAKPS